MSIPFLIVLLTYLSIGFGFGILFHVFLRRPFIGGFWGYTIVGVIGAALGGLFDLFLKDYWKYLTNLFGLINIFPPLIGALILIGLAQGFYNAKDD
ncbi:MAG: hypothetical protein N2442_05685 [Spirochaetes bacterium]|nr:hypothetical protein [Spirochaetota bacterium]